MVRDVSLEAATVTVAELTARHQVPAGRVVPAAPVRRWMQWTQLADREPPARLWPIPQWLTTGAMYLGGAGGAGKSQIAQQVGTALTIGRPFIDAIERPITALGWFCEDEHNELWRRQAAICRYFSVGMAELAGKFTIDARVGLDNTLFAESHGALSWTTLRNQLVEQVNDLEADLLIIDNIAQTFACNENDRHAVTAFVNGLLGVRPDKPFTVMLLGHPSKATGSEFSGSTAWENAVRMRWYLGATLPDRPGDAVPDPNVRYLSKRKANYSAKDWRRFTYTDGVLVPDQIADGRRYDSGIRKEVTEAIVLKGLRRLIDLGIDTVAASNSPNFLPRRITDFEFHEDATKAELAAALNAQLADGRIVLEPVRGADRHQRKVLRPAGGCGK